MPQRPVIGLVTQTQEAVPGRQPASWIMGQCYVRALTAAGAVPWLIPLLPGDESTLRAVYERLDGLCLTGGVDVDPAAYGEERQPLCDRPDPARDWTDLALVRWAAAEGKPVFGICRGIQAINVACGGSLYQDVARYHAGAIKHDYFNPPAQYPRDHLAHDVRIEPGSRLRELLGAERVEVNSLHHQGIKRLAPGLTATAFAPDGLIEAIERSDGPFLMGVQWHPEEMVEAHAPMRRLFAGFVEAAGRR